MTISATSRKAGPYTGTGLVATYPFAFKVFSSSDVVVTRTDLTGSESVLSSGYSVSLNADQNNNPGGNVVLTAALTTGYLLTITSAVPYAQGVEIPDGGAFFPSVLNTALDKLTIFAQQLSEQVSRSVKVGVSSSTTPDQLISQINAAAASTASSASAAANSSDIATAKAGEASASAVAAAASAASVPVDALRPASIGVSVQAYSPTLAGIAAGTTALSFRNKAKNGGFQINQRGSVSVSGSVQYGPDRWLGAISGGTGISGSFTNGAFPGVTGKGGYITASFASGVPLFEQRFESSDVVDLNGKTITVSGKYYQDTGSTVGISIALSKANTTDNFIAVTPLATNTSNNIPSGVVTNFTATFSLGSADASNGLAVQIRTTTPLTGTSKNFAISDFQLEAGSVATPFEHRPIDKELAACQRYCFTKTGNGAYGVGQALSSSVVYAHIEFPVTMRASPTLEAVSSIVASMAGGGTVLANTAVIQNATPFSAHLNMGMASASFVAGDASLVSGNASGSFIRFVAEL